MFTKTILRAKTERSVFGAAVALVVILLSVLFAAAILAALAPHPIGDPTQASIEGGL